MQNYLLFIMTIAGVYSLLGLGLMTIWGQAGMVNLGLAGFFALGAYTSAILTTQLEWSIGLAWLCAILVAACVGMVVTWITKSMRGDYLAIITLSFAEVIRLVAINESWLTNSIDGISNIPGPFRSLWPEYFNFIFLAITWLVVLLAYFVVKRVIYSPFGRVLRAIRDDDQVAAVAGKKVLHFKIKAFMLGSGLAGLAGALYAHFTAYIAPDVFTPVITIYIFLAVTAGGYTRPAGAIVGALFVIFLLEGSRFLVSNFDFITALQAASLREVVISVMLILLIHLRPQGLFPEFFNRVSIKDNKNA